MLDIKQSYLFFSNRPEQFNYFDYIQLNGGIPVENKTENKQPRIVNLIFSLCEALKNSVWALSAKNGPEARYRRFAPCQLS
jgi:hypothetical protein